MSAIILGLLVLAALFPRGVAAGDRDIAAVASYVTSVEDQDQGVKTNLQLACRRLNGHVIPPKSVFSFNAAVGEGSARNGFVYGRVLYREETRLEPGGGLCQASTTAYNALLLAGFQIVERHRHSQPITYAPLGLDATIMYGKKDLRMKNPFDRTFYMEATLTDKTLTVALRSDPPLPYRYEIVTEEEDVDVPILDRSRPVRQGISVYVNRKRYSGEKLVDSALLYRDFFPPVYIK